MLSKYLWFILCLLPSLIFAQSISKPIGCFAGTNGTNPAVLAHSDARGVLLVEKWTNIEPTPGVYDFSSLNNKINTVTAAGLPFSLAIAGGAFGSPGWLIDSLNVEYHSFIYQNQTWRLPLWWDTTCNQKLTMLVTQLGNQYGTDSMLSHIYVTQMTVNGIEGHLNGVDMTTFASDGYTDQKWITAAKSTAHSFANAFPDKPIVFEIHEIDSDTIVPATIINDLTDDPSLCNRVGLGMWWLSGKSSYQTDLLEVINNFPGDKYAQVIGRSDQVERFQDSLYSRVFTQAKSLGIRYIEPWPYEFQYHTHDSLIQDFNTWADAHFSAMDTCSLTAAINNKSLRENKVIPYPNPTSGLLRLKLDFPYQQLEVSFVTLTGQRLFTMVNQTEVDISRLPSGLYILEVTIDKEPIRSQLITVE